MPAMSDEARALALEAARVADQEQASDVVVLSVGSVLDVVDYFVIAGASNRRFAPKAGFWGCQVVILKHCVVAAPAPIPASIPAPTTPAPAPSRDRIVVVEG